MTKEEAINYLERSMAIGEDDDSRYHNEVLEFIIKALEQKPSVDAVSRQAVLNEAYAYGNGLEPDGYCVNVEDIQALPPVTPTQKWIPVSERLPNIHNRCERYYVTLKSGDVDIAMFTECNGEHWWNFNSDDIVAWQPLPPSYKGE